MATVELKKIRKVYGGNVTAVEDANFVVNDKEFVVLVGPSGCGKTTTLRMVAGLEDITAGEIYIDDKVVNDVAPKDRDIAMVFQNYALYPHMSVYDNMAFGLKIRKYSKKEIDDRVKEAAQILDIGNLLHRKPKELSGGQRQRVAVGRAIVRKPKVFLFDEPLSNLDAKLRVQMRAEISGLHSRLQATMIYVTHDQVEAMTMADKIVVMKDGIIHQIGDPLTLYNNPVNKFVAGFIGSPPMNMLNGTIKKEDGALIIDEGDFKIEVSKNDTEKLNPYIDKSIIFGIRPENLIYLDKPSEKNCITTTIAVIEPLGAETHLDVMTKSNQLIAKCAPKNDYVVGKKAYFEPRLDKINYFDTETELAIN